jgi:hypothetical protein
VKNGQKWSKVSRKVVMTSQNWLKLLKSGKNWSKMVKKNWSKLVVKWLKKWELVKIWSKTFEKWLTIDHKWSKLAEIARK